MSPTTTDATSGTWEPGSAAGGMRPEPFLDWQAVWPGTSGYEPDGRAYTVGASAWRCSRPPSPSR